MWTYVAAGLPWSLLFPLAAWRGARRGGFLLLWMGLMAVPLSLSRGKIDYYLLPLLPAASLVIGSHLAAPWDRADRAWARAALIAFALIALVPAALQPRIPTDWLPAWPAQVALIALGGGRRPGRGPGRGATLTFAGWPPCSRAAPRPRFALLAGAFLPAFRDAQPNAAVVTDVQRERAWRPDAELAACGDPVARQPRPSLRRAARPRRTAATCGIPRRRACPSCSSSAPRSGARWSRCRASARSPSIGASPPPAMTVGQILGGLETERIVLLANYPTDDPVAETKRVQDRKRALRQAAAEWEAAQREHPAPAPPVRP